MPTVDLDSVDPRSHRDSVEKPKNGSPIPGGLDDLSPLSKCASSAEAFSPRMVDHFAHAPSHGGGSRDHPLAGSRGGGAASMGGVTESTAMGFSRSSENMFGHHHLPGSSFSEDTGPHLHHPGFTSIFSERRKGSYPAASSSPPPLLRSLVPPDMDLEDRDDDELLGMGSSSALLTAGGGLGGSMPPYVGIAGGTTWPPGAGGGGGSSGGPTRGPGAAGAVQPRPSGVCSASHREQTPADELTRTSTLADMVREVTQTQQRPERTKDTSSDDQAIATQRDGVVFASDSDASAAEQKGRPRSGTVLVCCCRRGRSSCA